MNRFEKSFTPGIEARLRYGDADYQIVSHGDYVRCAVSGKSIPLSDLRYWNVDYQEAYASAQDALKKLLESR